MTAVHDKVIVIKLMNGEELIGKVVSSAGREITLTHIYSLHYVPQAPGQMGLAMLPYSPATVDTKTFNSDHITYTTDPAGDLLERYNMATGAIVTPNKSLIVG